MKVTILFLVALLGYGCAAKKLAVDHADTLLSQQIQKRIPLYSEQKKELDRDIVIFLNQSKPYAKEMIPVVDEITLEKNSDVKAQYEKLEEFYLNISKDFSAMFSKYMAKLDKKQQKDFFVILKKENKDIMKKDRVDRLESVEDRLKSFLGVVTNDQKDILSSYGDYFVASSKLRVARRQKLHEEFKSIYEQEVSESTRKDLIQTAFVKYQQESLKFNKNFEIVEKMVPTLTTDQKSHFKTKTTEVKELLSYYLQVDY